MALIPISDKIKIEIADDQVVLWHVFEKPSFAASVTAILMVKNPIYYNW